MTSTSWQASASCADLDPKYFEFTQKGDPGFTKEKNLARKGEAMGVVRSNEIRLKKGQKVCDHCPVRGQCLDTATPVDKFWTIRGGLLPVALVRPLANAPTETLNDYIQYTCPNGHGTGHISKRLHKGVMEDYCLLCKRK